MGAIIERLRFLVRRHPLLYRFRYALITRLGDGFDDEPPASDQAAGAPPAYADVVERLDLEGANRFDDAKRIAFDVSRGHLRGSGLGLTSVATLERIYGGQRVGVCSDYTQVFLGLCQTAGIAAREWGLCSSFEHSALGHVVAEVYCDRADKWIFLDPLYSLYAMRAGEDVPLSVTEIVDLVCAGRAGEIATRLIDPDGKPGAKRDSYVDRYFQPHHAFFLLINNDVFGQDRFLRWVGVLPPAAVHMAMIVAGSYQQYRVYTNATNREEMAARVGRLKGWLRRVTISVLLASAAGVATLLSLARLA